MIRTKSRKTKYINSRRSSRRKSRKSRRSLKHKSKKSRRSRLKSGRCEPSSLKKYINRASPPYGAQNCKNHKKLGNDGLIYVSKPDKNGVYHWKKFKD